MVTSLADGIPWFAGLVILSVGASSFAVDWQRFVLSGGVQPFAVGWGVGWREVKTAALLIALFSPVIGAAWLGPGSRAAVHVASTLATVGLFPVLALKLPAIAAGSRDTWRPLRANTPRWAFAFGITLILAGLCTVQLLATMKYVATPEVVGHLASGNQFLDGIAFLMLALGTILAFYVLAVAPPVTVAALVYRHLSLETPLLNIQTAPQLIDRDSVLILTPHRELLNKTVTSLVILIPWLAFLLWTAGGWWTLLLYIPIAFQLSYVLLYVASTVLANERTVVDHETIRWVSAFDECVVFLRDVSEVQVRRAGLSKTVICLVFADLERALAHDFYQRKGEPAGFARAVLSLHRNVLDMILRIDLGGFLKGLKGGSLPSGIGARVDLYLEGHAALFKDTLRFNFEKCGVHVMFLPVESREWAIECARELERRRTAAAAYTASASPA